MAMQLHKREALLQNVVSIMQQFLLAEVSQKTLGETLAHLAAQLEASSAYLFEIGNATVRQIAQWQVVSANPVASFEPLPLETFKRTFTWATQIESGELIQTPTGMNGLHGQLHVIAPIHAKNRWLGFLGIGLPSPEQERLSSQSEALKTAATLLGVALFNKRTPAHEAKYHIGMEQATDAIMVVTPLGEFREVNPRFCEMIGYTREELVRMSLIDVVTKDSTLLSSLADQSELSQNRFQAQEWLVRKDQRRIFVEVNALQLDDRLYYGVLQDVSERKQSEELLKRRSEAMAALYETSLAINSQPDVTTLLRTIVERSAKLLNAPIGGLYLVRPDKQSLELVVAYNLEGNFVGTVLQFGEGVSGKVAQSGEAVFVANYSQWEGQAQVYQKTPFRRILGVPLKVGGRVIGAIDIADMEKTTPYDEEDIRLLSLFADQAAIALTNTRLIERVYEELAERKKAEDALQISEQRFRMLTENSPDYIYILDLQTREGIYFNRQELLGYSAKEVRQPESITFAIHSEDVAMVTREWRKAIEGQLGENPLVEYRVRHKHGHWEWLQSRFTVLTWENEKPRELLVTNTIVTNRKRAEEALAQSLNFYLSLLDTFPVPIWRSELDTRIHFLNTSWFSFTGLTLGHNSNRAWKSSFHPEDLDKWEQKYLAAFADQRGFEVECRLRHSDGNYHTVVVVGQPFYDLEGAFAGFIGVLFDITEIREAQQKSIDLTLERARVKMLEEFIGDVSHDLRTPLSTIILNTYLLRAGPDDDKRLERLNILESQAERLNKTVQDLLDISRLEINITELTFTQIDINQLLTSIAQFYAPHIAKKNLQLTLNLTQALPPILANETQFHRGIANFVENAMKYTKKGGISLKTYLRGELIVVEVADTGVGISVEHLPRIFDRFYKADRARTTEGAGLGLAISKKIIEAHGGKIEVESIEGVGTTFFVVLPTYKANA
ncbi:MAG: PAS domain S-box protein [Chloroflexi bacterium]|nr:PAS domain S-box protein [Chloroflexota bacterium]